MQENRRAKMTRKMLNDGLMQSLAKKPLSRITVKEICETADVNRSTYYAHFHDPFDQIRKLEEELIAGLEAHVTALPPDQTSRRPLLRMVYLRTLVYMQQHRELFRLMYNPNTELDFQDDMMRFFTKQFHVKENLPYYNTDPRFLHFAFSAFGAAGLMRYWLLYEPAISAQEMAEHLTALTMGDMP